MEGRLLRGTMRARWLRCRRSVDTRYAVATDALPWIEARTLVAAGVLLLTGGLTACGAAEDSTPADAAKSDFCKAFTNLRASTPPRTVAEVLSKVGTPPDIDDNARHGFLILVDKLRHLPAHAKQSDLRAMARNLKPADQTDVVAFLTYFTHECKADLPS